MEIFEALSAATSDEAAAVEFLEARRWGQAPRCPRCNHDGVYQMQGKDSSRNRDYRWRCRGCKKMFSVRTGTVMEGSRLPIRVWLTTFWRACASKKGISALQLSREMEITHKSALYCLHRIRYAMSSDRATAPKLTGVIEADETLVGGRPRCRWAGHRGRRSGTEANKLHVFGILERDGDVRFRAMDPLTTKNLAKAVGEHADTDGTLMTDEAAGYIKVGPKFSGGHKTTNHSHHE